jgi:hypothetical protein
MQLLLFIVTKLRDLQQIFAIYLYRFVFYFRTIKAFKNYNFTNSIICFSPVEISSWIFDLQKETNYNIIPFIIKDISAQTIKRLVFKICRKSKPKCFFIVFPDISYVETLNLTANRYMAIVLPQIKNYNIDYYLNKSNKLKGTYVPYSNFLYNYTGETLLNDFFIRLMQIVNICKIQNIGLTFLLPSLVLKKYDTAITAKLANNYTYYNSSTIGDNEVGLFFKNYL